VIQEGFRTTTEGPDRPVQDSHGPEARVHWQPACLTGRCLRSVRAIPCGHREERQSLAVSRIAAS
jgi:hypothetical protein